MRNHLKCAAMSCVRMIAALGVLAAAPLPASAQNWPTRSVTMVQPFAPGNAGDVAIWDNTATQHCAINDYGEEKRVVRRSTIMGEAPVSVDGRRSVTRSKTAKPVAAAPSRQPAAA